MTNFQGNERKGENPVNKLFNHHWEETTDNVLAKIGLQRDAQTSHCTEAWGVRLDTALLTDLSEEECESLAEHVQTCSACATRLRHYKLIEMLAERFTQESFSSPSSGLEEKTERRIREKAEKKYHSLMNKKEKERRGNILRKHSFGRLHLFSIRFSPFLLHWPIRCFFVQVVKKLMREKGDTSIQETIQF